MALGKLLYVVGNGETSSSMINSQALTDIGTLMSQIWTWITGNPFLTLFLTVSLIFVAIRVFKGVKRTSRG